MTFLQRCRGYTETYYDDNNVRMKLGLPGSSECQCADILSLSKPERLGVNAVAIAEAKAAKSASADHIAQQLGTAAAAAFRLFGAKLKVNLMVFTDQVFWAQDLQPSTRTDLHIVAQYRNWGRNLVPTLYDPVARLFVQPRIDDRLKAKLGHFSDVISTLPIEVVTSSQLAQRAAARV